MRPQSIATPKSGHGRAPRLCQRSTCGRGSCRAVPVQDACCTTDSRNGERRTATAVAPATFCPFVILPTCLERTFEIMVPYHMILVLCHGGIDAFVFARPDEDVNMQEEESSHRLIF